MMKIEICYFKAVQTIDFLINLFLLFLFFGGSKLSKIYIKYLELKRKDNDKYYLFRSGNFYIFIADDAKKISDLTTLKLTNLSKDVVKCGFPLASLDKYLNLFKNLNLDVFLIV